MICEPCTKGADLKTDNQLGMMAKAAWHKKCRGDTWCDCQHRSKK